MEKRLIPAANKLVDVMIKELKQERGAQSHVTEFELTKFFNQYSLDTVSRVKVKYVSCTDYCIIGVLLCGDT